MLPKPFLLVLFCSILFLEVDFNGAKDLRCLLVDKV
jgi:hypothetical protein